MASSTTSRRNGTQDNDSVVEMATRLILQLQQDPGRGSEEWPSVTMQQLRVMTILYGEGPTRVSVLARRLKVSTPTITGILDRLVRQGLTYRADDPRDRRVVLNALTDKGREVIEQLQPIDEHRLASAIERLTPDQKHSLETALRSLVNAIEDGNGR
jgi:DNA-binding MarR family transcriptional regulator